jgi:hypothetical protein
MKGNHKSIVRKNEDGQPVKSCTRCGGFYPIDTKHFHANRTSPDGLSSQCKPCRNSDRGVQRLTEAGRSKQKEWNNNRKSRYARMRDLEKENAALKAEIAQLKERFSA